MTTRRPAVARAAASAPAGAGAPSLPRWVEIALRSAELDLAVIAGHAPVERLIGDAAVIALRRVEDAPHRENERAFRAFDRSVARCLLAHTLRDVLARGVLQKNEEIAAYVALAGLTYLQDTAQGTPDVRLARHASTIRTIHYREGRTEVLDTSRPHPRAELAEVADRPRVPAALRRLVQDVLRNEAEVDAGAFARRARALLKAPGSTHNRGNEPPASTNEGRALATLAHARGSFHTVPGGSRTVARLRKTYGYSIESAKTARQLGKDVSPDAKGYRLLRD